MTLQNHKKMTTKKEKLAEINSTMREATLCGLEKSAKNPVPGMGNADADVLFIGEAPGEQEDETGLPFVGRSGKFLDEMLESISLHRKDVYITNIVKYRPPDNRDPTPSEIKHSFPWLRAQIDLIDPVLIVPLGRHALNRFFPKLKISEAHGETIVAGAHDLGLRTYYPLYHPAVALYGGKSRAFLLEDFSRIPSILQKVKAS